MTAGELAQVLGAQVLSAGDAQREIAGGMMCDVMSLSLARGFSGMAWITHRADMNALAVAVLTRAACLIAPAGVEIEEAVAERARKENFALMRVHMSAFEACARMWTAGVRGEEIR